VNSDPSTASDTSERLKITIEELSGIQTLLGSGELDPRILADFRDALAERGYRHTVLDRLKQNSIRLKRFRFWMCCEQIETINKSFTFP
jgi:hypothetical protein